MAYRVYSLGGGLWFKVLESQGSRCGFILLALGLGSKLPNPKALKP